MTGKLTANEQPRVPGVEQVLGTLGLACAGLAWAALLLLGIWPSLRGSSPDLPAWLGLLQGLIYLASMPPMALTGAILSAIALQLGRKRDRAGWRRAALGLGLGVVALGYWVTLLIWLMATSGG